MRPSGVDPDAEFLSADISMLTNGAERVIRDIEAQWKAGSDALYTQYIGDEIQTAIILGYTRLKPKNLDQMSQFRIYTSI